MAIVEQKWSASNYQRVLPALREVNVNPLERPITEMEL
jgi:hypothetical protein